jgi:proteasome lid subunit RPN8/RPN11
VYNLVTKRAFAYKDATVEWVDGNLGSKLTMKYPSCYLMEPGAQIDAMRDMRERGESLLAIFHSHPDSPAVPSTLDLARAAYPDTIYLIAAKAGEEPAMNAYYYDGNDFEQIDIHIT